MIGLGSVDAFAAFAEHVQKKYRAEPGFITMNVPMLLPLLDEAGVKNPIVCANVNKIGFRMSGGIEGYREAAETLLAAHDRDVDLRFRRDSRRAKRSSGCSTSLMSSRSCSARHRGATSRTRSTLINEKLGTAAV